MSGAESARGREGGGDGREGTGQVVKGLVGRGEDFSHPEGNGALEVFRQWEDVLCHRRTGVWGTVLPFSGP